MEKLPTPKRKQIIEILDAFLGNETVKKVDKKKSLPKRDQKALLHYLDTLAEKNVVAGELNSIQIAHLKQL